MSDNERQQMKRKRDRERKPLVETGFQKLRKIRRLRDEGASKDELLVALGEALKVSEQYDALIVRAVLPDD